LAKAALTENELVKFEHFVTDGYGSVGGMDALGNTRGSRAGTLLVSKIQDLDDGLIALNDAEIEALV
jgi:hypothetical protein